MKKLKLLALAGATAAAMTAGTVQAEQYYGFMTTSVNYLDWTAKAEERTDFARGHYGAPKADFVYLEIEGGAGYDWGDVYGFVDFENPGNINNSENSTHDKIGANGKPVLGKDGKPLQERDGIEGKRAFRVAAKGSIAYNLGKTNWNAYGHIYTLTDSTGFFDQNIVLGASYDISTDSGFWMKPFLGLHYENQRFAGAGFNGFMAGWVLGYNFKAFGQDFMVSQWHETEFAREDQFRGSGGGFYINKDGKKVDRMLDKMGQNGAVSLWWNATKKFTAGIQYRYADQKLGTATYHDAVIFTAKYNF